LIEKAVKKCKSFLHSFLTGFFDSLSERLVKKRDIVYSIFIEMNIKEVVL